MIEGRQKWCMVMHHFYWMKKEYYDHWIFSLQFFLSRGFKALVTHARYIQQAYLRHIWTHKRRHLSKLSKHKCLRFNYESKHSKILRSIFEKITPIKSPICSFDSKFKQLCIALIRRNKKSGSLCPPLDQRGGPKSDWCRYLWSLDCALIIILCIYTLSLQLFWL